MFVTNWISTTKIQKISEITNFFRHYFLSRTEVEFINLQRKRYKIEAKNSELKNVLGYDRALSYGLSCMEMQGALTIFAANVKRILKLMQNA